MVVLIDFAILVIIKELLRVTLVILSEELYMFYFNYEIFILNDLNKMKDKVKV